MKTVVDNQPSSVKYPFIGICLENNLIVLFHDYEKGIVLNHGRSPYEDGYYSTSWVMTSFIPFQGSVTIANS